MSKPSTPERNSRLAEEIRVMNKLVAVIVRIGKPNALRILEAAEGVDKEWVLWVLRRLLENYAILDKNLIVSPAVCSIRALLESLPDPQEPKGQLGDFTTGKTPGWDGLE